MNLFDEFCREIGLTSYNNDEYDIDCNIDNSEFNYVDGEEGDNGIQKHYTRSGNELIAIVNYYGGDSYDVEFTKIGSTLFTNKLKEYIKNNLEKLELC